MANRFENAADLAIQRAQKLAHVSITYRRGGHSVVMNAIVGRTVFRTQTEFGHNERVATRDYIVARSDLVLDGTTTEPRRGDVIEEARNGKIYTYHVTAIDQETFFRQMGPSGTFLRIHTVEVAAT